MSHMPRSAYSNMTNAADTYYGTLFSHLSYGMGENGGGANPTPTVTYPDAATAAAAAAAAMAAATGVGDWTNVNNYQQGSGMLTSLNQPIPTPNMAVGGGVTNPTDLAMSSGPANATPANMTSPYCATLLAAVAAAAAAAAYPVHPTQSSNVSAGSTTPNADYAALYYRSSGPRQSAVSSAANPYSNAAYPTASWPYSVSPSHYTNNSQLIDRINPNLVSMDGWSTPNGQSTVIPTIGTDGGRQQTQHIPSTMFPSTAPCDRTNHVQKDPMAQSYFTLSSNRKATADVPASQSLSSTGDDRSGLYSMLSAEGNDEVYMPPATHSLVNGTAGTGGSQGNYGRMEPFAQQMCQHNAEQQQTRQQQRILDEFGRLSIENNRNYSPTSQAATVQSPESNVECNSQPSNSTQWQYDEVSNDMSNREHGTRSIGGILRPAIPANQQQLSGTMAFSGHTAQPVSEAPRAKTWANIAGQPPKGSAAVLMNSTGWSVKRIPGHVLTQGSRGSLTTPSASVIVAKPQNAHAKSDDHSNTNSASFRSARAESSGNPENGHNATPVNGKGTGYDESLQLLQRDAELLHQRLAKSINPAKFDTNVEKARFFVIKSFSEDDIHRSIKYAVWCSTELGNKKLDAAFVEAKGQYPIYLFYSVNGSGHFCGMAEMTSRVDYDTRMRVWAQDKWQGAFSVRWIFVKDVPNTALRHIRVETNENKPVTHSRDTTELPLERGRQVMEVFANYSHTLSIFDDFVFYEQRERQDGFRRKEVGNRRN